MKKNKDSEINIAIITDKNYLFPAFVTIESLISTSQSFLNITCIVTEKLDAQITEFENMINKKFKNVNLEFIYFETLFLNNIKTKFHISKAAFVKIYLPEILSNWDKCIFLDSDLLIRDDISILWNEFFDGSDFELGAVWNPGYFQDNEFIGIEDTEKTFNSGVMVMNLERMRENQASEKLKKFIDNYNDKTRLNDQPAFNFVYRRRWKELPLKWNCQFQFFLKGYQKIGIEKKEQSELQSNPSIVHFTTASKPWKFRSLHPFKGEFYTYYEQYKNTFGKDEITVKDLLKKGREFAFLKFYKV